MTTTRYVEHAISLSTRQHKTTVTDILSTLNQSFTKNCNDVRVQ